MMNITKRHILVCAAIAIVALNFTGVLRAQTMMHAQTAMRAHTMTQPQTTVQDEPRFAKDRVLVKLANTPAIRSKAAGPGKASSPPDLGISYSEIRLLNPSKENASTGAISTMSVNDKQNNVYVLALEEKGEDAVKRVLEILNANPAVEIAEPVFLYKICKTPNDQRFSEQYALNAINALQAWNITTGSKSVVVGIIDTGMDGAHSDLTPNLWVNPNPNQNGYVNDIHGYDFVNQRGGIPTDKGDHGTHVSGIIGAKGNNREGITGINWDVSLAWLGVGIDGNSISIDAVIEALNYANNQNIQITNNSYGSYDYSSIFEDAIRNYNGLFVAGAGNDANNNDLYPFYPASYQLPNIISVASTDQNDILSSFSNFGANSVHIAAPGSNILSTITKSEYEEKSGTSMAAPHVAGVTALMKSIRPDISPAQIREMIITSARYAISFDGFGFLDAHVALLMATTDNLSSLIDLSQNNPSSSGLRWTFSNNVYTVSDGAKVTITGNNAGSERRVEVMAGAKAFITLENTNITGLAANQSPLLLGNGSNVTLTLVGTNTLTAGSNCAGIQTTGATLTISGMGSLTATGGSNGAGLGGGISGAGGYITANDVVVTATGGSNAQGIGRGGGSGVAGTLAMNGNAIVIANSVGDITQQNKTGGILFAGNSGAFYGESVTISANVTFPVNLIIPEGSVLVIPETTILTIPAGITLTNNGRIINYGRINIIGALMNTGEIVNLGTINGTISGIPAIPDFPMNSNIDLGVNYPYPRGTCWTFAANVYTILDEADVTITGTSANERRIAVAANANVNITLNDVNINLVTDPDDWQIVGNSPLFLNAGSDVTLTLEGTNTLMAGNSRAGIQAPEGTKLIIGGSGSLAATGRSCGAGIGGGGQIKIGYGSAGESGGNITINSGTVTAIGHAAAGIGGGWSSISGYAGSGGIITITGGTVTAIGSEYAAGIGGGSGLIAGGNITISGGIVYATNNVNYTGSVGIGRSGDEAGTLTMNGNAIIFANSVGDMSKVNKTGGILVVAGVTHWYGDNNLTLSQDVTIPVIYGLTIDEGKIVTISSGTTLTNYGTIINSGTITINGTLINNGLIINYGTINGTVSGKSPVTDFPLDSKIDLSIDNPFPQGNGWSFANNIYTIFDGADITVTGTSTNQKRIEVVTNATAHITLKDVTIETFGHEQSPLLLNIGANLTLTLDGVSTLAMKGSGYSLGIWAHRGSTLTIDGTGRLAVTGGSGGIGGGGNIYIKSGVVTAKGSVGIVEGNITIAGGTVTAIGDSWGILASTLTMNGNAIVFASSVSDTDEDRRRRTRGILFEGNRGTVYGTVVLADNLTVPSNYTLTIPTDATLTIPNGKTFTNNGTVSGCGAIIINGKWTGSNPVMGGGNTIDLSIDSSHSCGKGWTYANNIYTILNGAEVIIAGNSGINKRLIIASNAKAIITVAQNLTIPSGYELIVPAGATLTISSGITLTNNGKVVKFGAINHGGNYGIWAGNPYIVPSAHIDLSEDNTSPAGIGWTFSNDVYTIESGADVTVTGNNEGSERRIDVAPNAKDVKITLKDVTIGGLGFNQSPLLLNIGAEVEVTLDGINGLTGGTNNAAGIEVPQTTTLSIGGTGSLTATGTGISAGIGDLGQFNDLSSTCGSITITSGMVTAIGSSSCTNGGSGIGGGNYGSGGTITISGGTVTAIADNGAGIGGGYKGSSGGLLSMDGNAVVFASSLNNSSNVVTNIDGVVNGILFDGNTGTFYGTKITITDDVEIPDEYTLTIPTGKTLTIPAGRTLTNNGTVINCGTIIEGGGYGIWAGNEPVTGECPAFVAVTNIEDVPTTVKARTPLTLSGTVFPADATNQNIIWSVYDAGTTGTTIVKTNNFPSLRTTGSGTVTVRASILNGTSANSDYTQDFSITVTFVPVTNIDNVPATTTMRTPLTLTATVVPSDATNQTIVWSVHDAGTTGATISSNILNTTAAGTVTVRATITNGTSENSDYIQDFSIIVTFVPVTNIENVPATTTVRTPLTLTATVVPSDATNQTIVWSVHDAGTTGATISSNILNTTAAGTVTVRATIANGASENSDYMQDFSIIVPFVPVTNIENVPATTTVRTPLTLTATVVPSDATNQTIVWSVHDAGTTGATITGNILNTTASGTVTVRAIITNGVSENNDYTQDFSIIVTFVPVTNIDIVPTTITMRTPLTLTGTVVPDDATNQTILWSVHDAGATGATISGNILNTTAAGTVSVKATIENGKSESSDYIQIYNITVSSITNNPELTPANLLKAWVDNGQLRITGPIAGETVSIFSASGTLVYKSIATSNEMNMPLSAKGVYIVSAGDRTVKVVYE